MAEDGNKYPFARPQAAILLAAGKTHDAIWTPAAAGDVLGVRPLAQPDRRRAGRGRHAGEAERRRRSRRPAASGAPVAVNDAFATPEDAALAAAATCSPTTPARHELRSSSRAPARARCAHSGDGSFTYTPAPNFFGVDSFTYRAVNGSGSSLATAIITVSPVPDAPVALAQAVGVQATESVPVTLGGTDADGDALTFYLTSLPANGTLSLVDPLDEHAHSAGAATSGPARHRHADSRRHVIYTPTRHVSGADTFSFVASDDAGATASAAAAVTVTVHPLADPAAESLTPLTLNVVGPNGAPIAGGFRWTLEEDRTYNVQPGVLDPNTLSVSFHASYMPVTRSGDETTAAPTCWSIRPSATSSPCCRRTGRTPTAARRSRPGSRSVTVRVNSGPMPTAQIRVRVFQDNAPLNGMWDTDEVGLAGFAVTIEDAGGRYGMSAAQQLMDAFGNPIGTTYAAVPRRRRATCASYEVAQLRQRLRALRRRAAGRSSRTSRRASTA